MTETAIPLDIKQANRVARVDARVRRRRRQILAAATKLMQQSGFHAMSMQSVADEPGSASASSISTSGTRKIFFAGWSSTSWRISATRSPSPCPNRRGPRRTPEDRVSDLLPGCQPAKRAAVNLTYRESKTLTPEGLSQIMALEIETGEPIREVYREGMAEGAFLDIDARIVAHNMLLTAHGWALKHWNLSSWLTLDEFIDQEIELLLAAVRARPDHGSTSRG